MRSTGKLTGTIRYAQLELERGGQIAGNISVISQDKNAGGIGATRPADRIVPPLADSGPKEDASKAS